MIVVFPDHTRLLFFTSCPAHISYIIKGRNPKFGMWVHLWVAKCRVPFFEFFFKIRIRNISPTRFEVAISNFVFGCVLMLEIVAYYFLVTVTLTSDLKCINIVRSISFILYDIELQNLVCGYIFWPRRATYCFGSF